MTKIRADTNMKMTRSFTASVREVNKEDRSVELSFSSEEPYERYFGMEILDHSPEAVNLSRLNEIGVVLYNHDRDRVIGKIEKAWVKDGRSGAIIRFDRDEESEKIYQKVKSGTLKCTSVGYDVSEWEDVKKGKMSLDGRFQGPCMIARKWMPYEISIVSIPADSTVGVGRSMESGGSKLDLYSRQLQINENLWR